MITNTLSAPPPLQRLIDRFEDQTRLAFKPRRDFFDSIHINPHRFARLAKGKNYPDAQEIRQLIHFFNQFFPVKADDLI